MVNKDEYMAEECCDVYVGGKVRVLELMRFFYLKHSGSKINFVL